MILSMQSQAVVFLITVAAGFFCGFVFDFFRIIRQAVKHGTFATLIEDIIFWILTILIIFYALYTASNGDVRVFNILGTFLGMTLYFLTISRVILRISLIIIKTLKKGLHKLKKSIIINVRRVRNWFAKKSSSKGA